MLRMREETGEVAGLCGTEGGDRSSPRTGSVDEDIAGDGCR
jgi:hypothetical protein